MATAMLAASSCEPEAKEEWFEADGTQVVLPDGTILIYEFLYSGWDYLVNDLDKTISVILQRVGWDSNDLVCFDLAPGESSERLMRGAYAEGYAVGNDYLMTIFIDEEVVVECVNDAEKDDYELYFYSNYQTEFFYEYFIDTIAANANYPDGVKIKRKVLQRTYHIDQKLLEMYAQSH
jgi:hypothetical protein